jgi:uncharacterized phage protein gp47/JayE
MTTYGPTSTGFALKTYADIRDECAAGLAEYDCLPQQLSGNLVNTFSNQLASAWEALQAVDSLKNVDASSGDALDTLLRLRGSIRAGGLPSTVTLTLSGTAGTVIDAGAQVAIAGTDTLFATTEAGTISVGGTVDVTAASMQNGPWVALAGTLTDIRTPVAGWSTVTNAHDALPGRDAELDPAFKMRSALELSEGQGATLPAMRAAIMQVADVTGCYVAANNGIVSDIDGIPAKSVWVIVEGGDATAIRTAIFDVVGAATKTYGSQSGTVTDSQGVAHTIEFDYASEVDVWIAIAVTYDATLFPTGWSTLIQTAVLALGDNLTMGKNIVARAIDAACFSVPGVLDAVATIGTSEGVLSETTIGVDLNQIGRFSSERLTITVSAGTP